MYGIHLKACDWLLEDGVKGECVAVCVYLISLLTYMNSHACAHMIVHYKLQKEKGNREERKIILSCTCTYVQSYTCTLWM